MFGSVIQIEYGLKRGTTDNSYLIRGGTHAALIDIPDQAFSKGFVETLKSTIALKDLSYLIISHVSPKRMESLTCLAEALPDNGTCNLNSADVFLCFSILICPCCYSEVSRFLHDT